MKRSAYCLRRSGTCSRRARRPFQATRTSFDRHLDRRWSYPQAHPVSAKPYKLVSHIGPSSTRYKLHLDRSHLQGSVRERKDRLQQAYRSRSLQVAIQTRPQRLEAAGLLCGVVSPAIPQPVDIEMASETSVNRRINVAIDLQTAPELNTRITTRPAMADATCRLSRVGSECQARTRTLAEPCT